MVVVTMVTNVKQGKPRAVRDKKADHDIYTVCIAKYLTPKESKKTLIKC